MFLLVFSYVPKQQSALSTISFHQGATLILSEINAYYGKLLNSPLTKVSMELIKSRDETIRSSHNTICINTWDDMIIYDSIQVNIVKIQAWSVVGDTWNRTCLKRPQMLKEDIFSAYQPYLCLRSRDATIVSRFSRSVWVAPLFCLTKILEKL